MSNPFLSPNLSDSRAPCPALNALANHGYISRTGRDIPFFTLLRTIKRVYNFTFPLALLLCLGGYLTVGRFKWRRLSWELDLEDLCEAGPGVIRIAHAASLVHENPEPDGAYSRLDAKPASNLVEMLLENTPLHNGLTLELLAKVRAGRELEGNVELSTTHARIARAEAALVFATLSGGGNHVTRDRLIQWFGFSQGLGGTVGGYVGERLPLGWWEHIRPSQAIGLDTTKRLGATIEAEVAKIKARRGIAVEKTGPRKASETRVQGSHKIV